MAVLLLVLPAAIPPGLPFAPWHASHGVKVEIARLPPGPPWVRGTAEIPASAERVFAAVTDYRHYREIFAPAIKTADLLDSGEGSARFHFVWPYPFPLRNRDAIVAYSGARLEGGAFVLSWKDDARPGDPKESVRIERVAGETRIEPLGAERCRVTYTYFGDLGGSFPAWAQEKAWKEEPVQYIRAIRRRLRLAEPGD